MTYRVILRKDVVYKDRTSPLCLLFFHDNRKKSVGLGVSVAREYWDAEAQKVADDCPDRDDIQFHITAKIKEYEKKIKKLEALEIPVTFETLFETVGKRMDCTVGDFFKQIIERLEKVEKYGSASKHKVTLALMQQFESTNMRFEELDLTYLREFEIFLRQRGNVNNSLATKFSVLKAVYNKAVSEGVLYVSGKVHLDKKINLQRKKWLNSLIENMQLIISHISCGCLSAQKRIRQLQ